MDVEIAAGPSNSASAATGTREEAGRKRLTDETACHPSWLSNREPD